MTITRPTNMSLQDWADQLALDAGVFVQLDSDNWREWALCVINTTPQFRAAPDPSGFADWRAWGERLCEVLA